MAQAKLNPVLQTLRGKIGDLVFSKRDGKMIIGRRPDTSKRIFSAAQVAIQERFRKAAAYGKMAFADPLLRAAYQQVAREKRRPIFSMMVADFFHPPSVDEIDVNDYTGQAGSTIAIRASDDFEVMGVDVSITNILTRAIIEQGAAVKSTVDAGRWVYTAGTSIPTGTQVRVEVTATDRPGHKTTKTENI